VKPFGGNDLTRSHGFSFVVENALSGGLGIWKNTSLDEFTGAGFF
jgi:hypothetical protein